MQKMIEGTRTTVNSKEVEATNLHTAVKRFLTGWEKGYKGDPSQVGDDIVKMKPGETILLSITRYRSGK